MTSVQGTWQHIDQLLQQSSWKVQGYVAMTLTLSFVYQVARTLNQKSQIKVGTISKHKAVQQIVPLDA